VADSPAVDVSVVVCTYNRASWLAETLASLRAQEVPAGISWEVLVADNGSTDDTADAVRRLRSRWPALHYLFEPTPGKSFALNTALQTARGRFVAFTDDDVLVDPHWLSEVQEALESTGAALIGGRVLPLWQTPRPPWFLEREFRGMVGHWDHGPKPFQITDVAGVPAGANMAARTDILRAYGGFHTGLGAGRVHRGADSEMGARLLSAGELLMYVPGALVYHRVHPNLLSKPYVRRWFYRRGIAHSIMEKASEGNVPKILRVPRWRYRVLLQTMARWAGAAARRDGRGRFLQEARLCMMAGFFAARWSGRYDPVVPCPPDAVTQEEGEPCAK